MGGRQRRAVGGGVLVALALVVPAASAAVPMGPSARACATAWSSASRPAQRAEVAADHPLRAWVIPTSAPACVIHFQLTGTRVLTATSVWLRSTAEMWHLALRPHSSFSTQNARSWSYGSVIAWRVLGEAPAAGAFAANARLLPNGSLTLS